MSVDIHWVVGQGTNVGKTTVAAALVRALSALGQRVVALEPYSGGKFIDVVDLMFERRHMTTARLFGGDGAKLIDGSPLLSVEVDACFRHLLIAGQIRRDDGRV